MIEGTLIRRKNHFDKKHFPNQQTMDSRSASQEKAAISSNVTQFLRDNLALFVTRHRLDAQ